MDHQVLEDIVNTLNAGARNYNVFLKCFVVPLPSPTETETVIKMVFGTEAKLGGIRSVDKASVWTSMKKDLLYAGDAGAGPDPGAMKSERLLSLMRVLEDEVRDLVETAMTAERFWLRSGHPAYPVFWDFAFLFSGKTAASILIGSSSD